MTEQTTPIPWRSLRLLRGGTETGTDTGTGPQSAPVPEASTEPGTEPVPVAGTAVSLTTSERAQLTARHWGSMIAEGAGQMWLHPDRLFHDMWHKGPAPMDSYAGYMKSAAWVPKELRDHKSGGFLKWLGWIHYTLTASLKLLALGLSALADKAIRLYVALAVVLVFAIAVVPHIHIHI